MVAKDIAYIGVNDHDGCSTAGQGCTDGCSKDGFSDAAFSGGDQDRLGQRDSSFLHVSYREDGEITERLNCRQADCNPHYGVPSDPGTIG